MSTTSLKYRPDLQGLRAIAVIAVLLFHVWPKIFRGGFVGVDVFFVISGYLITGLLLAEAEETTRVDLLRFWGRRMMRLLPAATIVLLAVLVGTLFWLPRTEWINTARHVFASAFYFENWSLVAQSVDYWAQGQAPTPVQHYWSLSIEEQFYIFWPPIVALAAFFGTLGKGSVRRYAMIFITLIFAASLYHSIVPASDAGSSYFKTTTRAWELGLGAFLAVAQGKISLPVILRSILGWLGLIAVLGAIIFINEQMRFPGWVAMIPTFGTALLILSGDAAFSPYHLLALKPAQYVGDISYSVYLWHWPIIVFFRPLGGEVLQGFTPWLIVALTFLLAIAAKYLIEDPFRFGRFSFHLKAKTRGAFLRNAYVSVAVMLLLTGGASGAMHFSEQRITEKLLKENFETTVVADARYPGAAAFDPVKPAAVPAGVPIKPNPQVAELDMRYRYRECMNRGRVCTFGNENGKTVVALVGDSHAMHYAPALETIALKLGWKLLVMVKVACPIGDFPLYSEGKYRGDCDLWRGKMLKWVAEAKPDYVITSGGLTHVYGGLPPMEKQVAGYRAIWNKFIEKGTRVIAIRDNPLMKLHAGQWMEVPPCLSWSKKPTACNKPRSLTLDSIPDAVMNAAQGQPGVGTIDFTQYLCTKDECPAVIGNVVVYRDAHHLTETFVNTLAPYVEKELVKVMKALPAKAQNPQ